MAKKAELLDRAKELGLEGVSSKNTIAELEAAINSAGLSNAEAEVVKEEKEETFAKSGRRSRKAIAEVEAAMEKEARKEEGDTSPQSEEAEAHVKRGPNQLPVLASNAAARTTVQLPKR